MKKRKDFPTTLKYKFYVLNQNFPQYFSVKGSNTRQYAKSVENQFCMQNNQQDQNTISNSVRLSNLKISNVKYPDTIFKKNGNQNMHNESNSSFRDQIKDFLGFPNQNNQQKQVRQKIEEVEQNKQISSNKQSSQNIMPSLSDKSKSSPRKSEQNKSNILQELQLELDNKLEAVNLHGKSKSQHQSKGITAHQSNSDESSEDQDRILKNKQKVNQSRKINASDLSILSNKQTNSKPNQCENELNKNNKHLYPNSSEDINSSLNIANKGIQIQIIQNKLLQKFTSTLIQKVSQYPQKNDENQFQISFEKDDQTISKVKNDNQQIFQKQEESEQNEVQDQLKQQDKIRDYELQFGKVAEISNIQQDAIEETQLKTHQQNILLQNLSAENKKQRDMGPEQTSSAKILQDKAKKVDTGEQISNQGQQKNQQMQQNIIKQQQQNDQNQDIENSKVHLIGFNDVSISMNDNQNQFNKSGQRQQAQTISQQISNNAERMSGNKNKLADRFLAQYKNDTGRDWKSGSMNMLNQQHIMMVGAHHQSIRQLKQMQQKDKQQSQDMRKEIQQLKQRWNKAIQSIQILTLKLDKQQAKTALLQSKQQSLIKQNENLHKFIDKQVKKVGEIECKMSSIEKSVEQLKVDVQKNIEKDIKQKQQISVNISNLQETNQGLVKQIHNLGDTIFNQFSQNTQITHKKK